MNQGNSGPFAADDGAWQDGGLMLHFPAQNQWVAILLAFQSQAWHTDDRTGHTLPHLDRLGPARTRHLPNPTGPYASSPPWSTRSDPRRSRRPRP